MNKENKQLDLDTVIELTIEEIAVKMSNGTATKEEESHFWRFIADCHHC